MSSGWSWSSGSAASSTPGLVAGVHVEDAALAAAAERDLAAAVDDDLWAGVVEDLGGLGQRDRDRVGATVERDDAAQGDGVHDRLRRAARRSARANDWSGFDTSSSIAVRRDRVGAGRIASRRQYRRRGLDWGEAKTSGEERGRSGPD